MARIYISSTYQDLKAYRDAVERALRKLAGVDVIAMEDYVADDARPLVKCLEDVRSCDIYLGIVAWRYGYVPATDNPANKSITEREYLEAKDKKRLIFLLDENAPWPPKLSDFRTGDNGTGSDIQRFRTELSQDKTCSFFNTPDNLASLVTAAVSNAVQIPPPPPPPISHFRELQFSAILAYSQYDEALAQKLQPSLAFGRDKGVLLSQTALFAQTGSDFETLEASLIRSATALILLTPTSLNQLKSQLPEVERALAVMRARMGTVGAVLVGVQPKDVPFTIAEADCFAMTQARIDANPMEDPGLPRLKAWLDASAPPVGAKVLGLPISVLAMNATEANQLLTTPGFVLNHAGKEAQDQFDHILGHLEGGTAALAQRYRDAREAWQPFAPADGDIRSFFCTVAKDLNKRNPPRLLKRQVKLQWYPFDVVMEMSTGPSPLGRVYETVASTGCILVVDELSLFHPALRDAFISSPFFNREQVAIVTVSPADPTRTLVSQAIETSLRKQLASVFRRYTDDLDPQCEIAIDDRRRLLRWLYASMPEAIANLRDPKPNRDTIESFKDEVGVDARSTGGEYPWAGGSRP